MAPGPSPDPGTCPGPSPWPWSLALALRPDPELGARLIQSFLERHVLSCHRLILSGELPQGRDVTGSVKN